MAIIPAKLDLNSLLSSIKTEDAKLPPIVQSTLVNALDILDDTGIELKNTASEIFHLLQSITVIELTRQVPKMGLVSDRTGIPVLLINPIFVEKVGNPTSLCFLVLHELWHMLLEDINKKRVMFDNKTVSHIATEAYINNFILGMLPSSQKLNTVAKSSSVSFAKVPTDENGEAITLDPEAVYDIYLKTVKQGGGKPESKEEFFSSRMHVYDMLLGVAEKLNDMDPDCPSGNKQHASNEECPGCSQDQSGQGGQGEEGQDQSGQGGNSGQGEEGQDQSGQGGHGNGVCTCSCHMNTEDATTEVLAKAIKNSVNDRSQLDPKANSTKILKSLIADNPESKMWGNIPLGAELEGVLTKEQKTTMWATIVAGAVQSKISANEKLRYAKKLPYNPMLARRGHTRHAVGYIFLDTSGSMYNIIEPLVDLLGESPDLELKIRFFDTEVYEVEFDSSVVGGGGTSFECIGEYLLLREDTETDPDFVLVITDGYAPTYHPKNPESWYVVITPGGTLEWPQKASLDYRMLDSNLDLI